ncbi:MAG: DUF4272 domain-containing protein [Actinomycetota bacterium]
MLGGWRPTVVQVADRALILYAVVRRGYIEHVIASTHGDPLRIRQGEAARQETERWLDTEGLFEALTDVERRLFGAPSGAWPADATADAMWRKESLGALLWALQHVAEMPPYDHEFDQAVLDDAIMRYGSVSGFRAEGVLRDEEDLDRAWMEADAWFGATEGRGDDDATIASVAAERYRAFSWLRDAGARPA